MSLYLAIELEREDKQKLFEKQLYLKKHCEAEKWEDMDGFHITVKFIGEDHDFTNIIPILRKWEQEYNPKIVQVDAKNFYRFEQGVSWIGVANSFPLYQYKHQIEEVAMKLGHQLKKDDHDGYTPHITMGYGVKESNSLNREFESIPVTVNNITLWGYAPKVNGVHVTNELYKINLK